MYLAIMHLIATLFSYGLALPNMRKDNDNAN